MLRIRERFDLDKIILPLAAGCDVPVNTVKKYKLRTSRGDLMYPVFYQYVSSTDPKIDRHLIFQALDWWSWYWVVVEVAVAVTLTGFLLFFSSPTTGVALALTSLTLTPIVLRFLQTHCSRCAKAEVREIHRRDGEEQPN